MMRRTTGFHDDQPHITVVEPTFELATSQALLLDDFPLLIGNSDLEYTLDQIKCIAYWAMKKRASPSHQSTGSA